jgi:hypothetical protein
VGSRREAEHAKLDAPATHHQHVEHDLAIQISTENRRQPAVVRRGPTTRRGRGRDMQATEQHSTQTRPDNLSVFPLVRERLGLDGHSRSLHRPEC